MGEGTKLDIERLYNLSKKMVNNPDNAMRSVLQYLRFDEQWFDISDPGISRESNWYLVLLASNLKTAPDLSSSQPFSYHVLQKVLRLMGWTIEEIDLLIIGNKLEELIKVCNPSMFSFFSFPLYNWVGWLTNAKISILYEKLTVNKDTFLNPSDNLLNEVKDLSHHFRLEPDEVIRKSFFDALSMLAYALQNNSSLFLILE
jgi:hypothetical protein